MLATLDGCPSTAGVFRVCEYITDTKGKLTYLAYNLGYLNKAERTYLILLLQIVYHSFSYYTLVG